MTRVAGPSGPTGRENGAQGRSRRPMPWVERLTTRCGLKGRETVGPALVAAVAKPVDRAFLEVAADMAQRRGPCEKNSRGLSGSKDGMPFFPQGIGLLSQPWAGISRPVGPDGPAIRVMFCRRESAGEPKRRLQQFGRLLLSSGGPGQQPPHRLRLAFDGSQQRLGRCIRCAPALLPIPERADGQPEGFGELHLRHAEPLS
jgi:hypothetical protein